jgi:GrpB-like predicted nucleotidyltransferase (UPF0157 family)
VSDEPVTIIDYDPAWRDRFAEQAARLTTILRPWLAAPVEHVGSTAVPGLRAKPVVDILSPVASLADAQASIDALTADGWLFWPDDPNRDYRLWFLRPRPEARTHHLHVIQHDHPAARAELAFRDVLRKDPAVRDAYATLKDRLAAQHRTDRDAYTDAKSEFIRSVLRTAGVDTSSRQSVRRRPVQLHGR